MTLNTRSMKTVEEKNRLIAEFMEYPGDGNGRYFSPTSEELVSADNLPYHTSFEWLIPVWKRINSILMPNESFRFTFAIRPDFCYILDHETEQEIAYNEHGATEEELVYETVVQFIERYNKIKQL